MTLYNNTFQTFENNYLGFATLIVLAQSCLGGAAAMSILSNGTSLIQMFQLAIVVLICMLLNTAILAQIKHKIIFNLTIASTLFSILFIIINHH